MDAIVFAAQAEAVEANVSLVEGNLDRVVEIGECAVVAHPEPG